jgi:diaminopimelate decarboxylase
MTVSAMACGFSYRGGVLHADDLPLPALAEAVGTPVYLYSGGLIDAAYRRLAGALEGLPIDICYAVKANGTLAVIDRLSRLGAGADVVSEGELRRALAAGVAPGRIVFSGVGKTKAEMAAALDAGIHQLNVESIPELQALSEVAAARGATAPVALRVNPDVDAGTLKQITTGTRHDKFGIALDRAPEAYRLAASLPGIAPVGIAVHIGSQISALEPYGRAFRRVVELAAALRAEGIAIDRLDLGGGFAIAYRDEPAFDLDGFARLIRELVAPAGCRLTIEPGRYLVGPAGLLVTRVLFLKSDAARRFLIVDAGMNDLMRPALYGAWHDILPVLEPAADAPREPHDVAGPVCESTDVFAKDRPLPPVAPGDLIAFADAGAYGAAMANGYNARPIVPELLIDGDRFAVVRKRPTFEETIAAEALPDWQAGAI